MAIVGHWSSVTEPTRAVCDIPQRRCTRQRLLADRPNMPGTFAETFLVHYLSPSNPELFRTAGLQWSLRQQNQSRAHSTYVIPNFTLCLANTCFSFEGLLSQESKMFALNRTLRLISLDCHSFLLYTVAIALAKEFWIRTSDLLFPGSVAYRS